MPNVSQQAFPDPYAVLLDTWVPKSPEGHLGDKLRRAMDAKGVTQADVARAFEVKPPTISTDWLKHGRIAKKHYPRLVSYFGLPYEWWFGAASADPQIEAVVMMMMSMTREQKDEVARSTLQIKNSGPQSGGKKIA